MVSYRVISDHFKKRMIDNDNAEISIITNYNAMASEVGVHQNIPFNNRDVRNVVNMVRRSSRLAWDAESLEMYFQKMAVDNRDFYYAIQINEKNQICNVFWSDARCRAAFKAFPDVVSFDTTFS